MVAKEQEESFNGFGGESEEVGGEEAVSEKGKAGKKKGRKRRRSPEAEVQEHEAEEELRGNNEETPAEVVNPVHGEEIPEERAFEGDGAETANTGLDGRFDDEDYTESMPKPKRSRKSNGTTKKRKRNTVKSNFVPETEEAAPEEQEPEEPASVLTEAKSSKNKARSTRSRKSRKPAAEEDIQEPEATQDAIADAGDNPVPTDLAALPDKIKRAKKKARVSPHKAFEDIVMAEEDDNDSAAVLHRPLTPAHISHHRTGSNVEDDSIEASAQLQMDARSFSSADLQDEPVPTPKQPSKKALGKRKASEVGIASNKKRKTQKDKAAGTPDLTAFGFFTQSAGNSRVIYSEPQRRATPVFTPINGPKSAILPPSAQRIPALPEPDDDSDVSEFVPEINKPSEPKKKRRLPIGDDEPSNANPKTPQKRSVTSKTPKSGAKTPSRSTTGKGRLSNEEVEAICTAVEEYREQNELTQVEINDLVQKDAKTEGLRLWKYVYDEAPDIPRTKILNLCRRKFHNFEARGSWTEEQDQELRDVYEKYPGKWKQIGESMNRFSEDCRDRWRNYLVCGDNMRKDIWGKEEEERFKEIVQECLEAVREMKRVSDDPRAAQTSDESLIDWNVVSQKMDRTRSRLQCLSKWKKLKERQEADVEDPVIAQPISETWRLEEAERLARSMKAREKLQLLYAIRDSGAGREGKIPWRRVQEELPGKARKMALRVCFRQMRQHIEDHEDMKLQDIVDLLIDAFEAAAPEEPTGYDDFDGFRASQRRLSKKQKRKSLGEVESSDDNGEGLSTITKKRKSRLSEKYVVDNEADDDIWRIPQDDEEPPKSSRRKEASSLQAEGNPVDSSGAKRKKKLRERMKDAGQSESQSQETDRRPSETSEDIHIALESLKTGKSKSRSSSAKKPTRILSNERVVESDEEEPPANEVYDAANDAVNDAANEDDEAEVESMDLDKLETYIGAGGPEVDEYEMDLNRPDTYTAAGGPAAEDDNSSFENDEGSPEHYDEGSVDLDEDCNATTNGAHEDHQGEESDFQDAGSVDLDAPIQTTYERRGGKSKRSASLVSVEEEPPKINGSANGHVDEERLSSDDDDMSDIPAKVPPKVIEPRKKKTKSKKSRLGLR